MEQQESFDELKSRLISYPVLLHSNGQNSFIVQTDASNMAIGAVLAQLDERGNEKVVQYASRQFFNAERKWDTREKELLAVVWACETFRQYLLGKECH